MFAFQIERSFPVNTGQHTQFAGIAFDGCSFWMTVPQRCQICQFTGDFCKKRCIAVKRPYTSICYDKAWKCFWALAEGSTNKIFKLNNQFCEIGCVTVETDECRPQRLPLTGVSCSADCRSLLVSSENQIALAGKDCGCRLQVLRREPDCFRYNSVLDMGACYLAGYTKGRGDGLGLYVQRSRMEANCYLPPEYAIADMADGPRATCGGWFIHILANKHCQGSWILECRISDRKERPCFEPTQYCSSEPGPRRGMLLHGIL